MRAILAKGSAAGIFLTIVLSMANPSFGQSCTAVPPPPSVAAPSATSLRSYPTLLHSPGRIAVDSVGNLFLSDPGSGKVWVRDRYGRLGSVVLGFDTPLGIAVDAGGKLYIGEQGKGSVSVFDEHGNLLRQLGQGDGEFQLPNEIAIDPDTDPVAGGSVFVTDSAANMIKVFRRNGTSFSFGGKGVGAGQFDFPTGVYVSVRGEVFVADQNNERVQVFDRTGRFLRCFSTSRSTSFSSSYGSIQSLTGDTEGRVYVAAALQSYVQVFDPQGALLKTIGTYGQGPGELRTPLGLAIDQYNRLFVASANNSRVEVFGLDNFSDPQVIAAVVQVDPRTVRRTKNGDVTVYIEMRTQSLAQVDPASITANGVPASPSTAAIGDRDGDGVPDLALGFDAQAVLATLPDGDGVLVVSGQFRDRTPFEGAGSLRVIPVVPAVVLLDPSTLKSTEKKSLRAYIEIPDHPLDQVDRASITANGVPATIKSVSGRMEIKDSDRDGTPDLRVEFDAQAVLATLPDGDGVVVVAGQFGDGTLFEGTAGLNVVASGEKR